LKKCERALGAVEVSDEIHAYRNTCTCMMWSLYYVIRMYTFAQQS
jgi:hypothetical protein